MPLVPEPRRAALLWLCVIVAVCVATGVASIVKVERRTGGACLVGPVHLWTLRELRPGAFESRAIDQITGQTIHYRIYQFDRQAFLDLNLPRFQSEVDSRIPWDAGEVVARLSASTLEIDLAERRTALEEARARLETLRSGAKPEELHRAQVAMTQAEAALEAYRPQFERSRGMHEERLISDSAWEEIAAAQRLRELDVELARSELEVLTSGARPEEIEAARVQVASLSRELDALQAMTAAQEICSPVSGWLRLGGPDGSMVTVSKLDTMVVEIVMPQRSGAHPAPGQEVRVSIPGIGGDPVAGVVSRVDRRALQTEAGSFIRVYAVVDNRDGRLEEGMEGRARVYSESVTLLDLILGDITSSVRHELESL